MGAKIDILEQLETLIEEYKESAPKTIVTKFSGTFEVYDDECDMHYIMGLERAADLIREITNE